MHAPPNPAVSRPRAIANWLLVVAALVFLMIVVGGITRLTESGLSITRWEPVSGTIPPLNEADWQREFNLYRESPQYQLVNRGMTLADFKFIFFWEYIHRLLGRVIGLAFALPLLWFAVKRAIPGGYGWKLVGLLALGGLQGAIGWWMVASGLVDVPEVSHIRLAVHLLTALAIFGALIWVALDLRALARSPGAPPARLTLTGIWALCLLFLQMLFGAYVAGLEAGYAFNSWPLMGDEFYPRAAEWMQPMLRNFVDNPVTVQFVHRWLAFVAAAVIGLLALRAWQQGDKLNGGVLAVAVLLQIQLGILTILTGVELWIGVAHQGMAALLLGALLVTGHKLGQRRETVAP
ncbi:COX15/CtaA family protein [Sphingosinicella sp. YJ22]|uniref:COX15/CtaA family protein n=1 Tax=Sphingosinicella sp. YJ22 TaxID=1104780 RepID=UPI00140744E9|nr:COX15/CtaA family protein [Sphingosinicella sp. YJ22]